jgi:hypothetical protein
MEFSLFKDSDGIEKLCDTLSPQPSALIAFFQRPSEAIPPFDIRHSTFDIFFTRQ